MRTTAAQKKLLKEIGQALGLRSEAWLEEVKHGLEDSSVWNLKRGLSPAQEP